MPSIFTDGNGYSPGGVPQSYRGQVVVCSECLQPQVFDGEQCAGCHSEFGKTAWPFVDMEILYEDMQARGLEDAFERLREAERKKMILHVSLAFKMKCHGLWENWISCPELGLGCQFCEFYQFAA